MTEEIFDALKNLNGCEMLCKPDLSLFDTMSCFEVMDLQMDARIHRKEALTASKARARGILKPVETLTDSEKHALLQELTVQFATWQDQAPLIQQTLFSSVYLGAHANYADCPVLSSFIHGMLYVVNIFYRRACMTTVLRDEDISFPPTTDQFSEEKHPVLKDLTLDSIIESLKEHAGKVAEFEPYLAWMSSLVEATACALEPDFL